MGAQEQILDNAELLVEIVDLLYATRILDKNDGSPCWCCMENHDATCRQAREATKRLWEK